MSQPPTLDVLYRLMEASRIVQTLQGARELGVFEQLEAGPATLDQLATETGVAPARLLRLLHALVSMHLVAFDGEQYSARVPRVMVDKMLALRPISSVLRDGPEWVAHTESGAANYKVVVPALSSMARDRAARLGQLLARPDQRILEVGAGAAGWSLAVASRSPGTTVVANDWAAVLERTREAVERAGLAPSYTYVPGDVFEVELGEGYDLVLVPLFLHLFDEPRGARLIQRLAATLAPGGRLAIVDVFSDADVQQLGTHLYSLELLSRTEAGQVHELSTTTHAMQAAGLEDVEHVMLGDGRVPMSVLMARRPR